jgi:hypothetical protein
MHRICTYFEYTLQMLPGTTYDFEFAEVSGFTKAREIGQIVTVFDDRYA